MEESFLVDGKQFLKFFMIYIYIYNNLYKKIIGVDHKMVLN